jgi:hypothetical protein
MASAFHDRDDVTDSTMRSLAEPHARGAEVSLHLSGAEEERA